MNKMFKKVTSIFCYAMLVMMLSSGGAQAWENRAKYDGTVQSIALSALPAEGRETYRLIKQGGPFPYDRDGVVFGNFERVLPKQPRGYYHEYTVKTPGARNRGTRRIISGGADEYYYTADHYQSFARIKE